MKLFCWLSDLKFCQKRKWKKFCQIENQLGFFHPWIPAPLQLTVFLIIRITNFLCLEVKTTFELEWKMWQRQNLQYLCPKFFWSWLKFCLRICLLHNIISNILLNIILNRFLKPTTLTSLLAVLFYQEYCLESQDSHCTVFYYCYLLSIKGTAWTRMKSVPLWQQEIQTCTKIKHILLTFLK